MVQGTARRFAPKLARGMAWGMLEDWLRERLGNWLVEWLGEWLGNATVSSIKAYITEKHVVDILDILLTNPLTSQHVKFLHFSIFSIFHFSCYSIRGN